MKTKISTLILIMVCNTLLLYGQPGSLDTTFDNDGKVTTDFGIGTDWGWSVTTQTDGKIIVVGGTIEEGTGEMDFGIVRYNPDGSLDNSFDLDGMVTTPIGSGYDEAYSVAIQPDGKILVAGISWSGNPSFDDFALVRYNQDGSLDSSFGTNGIVLTDFGGSDVAYSVAIQPDGKILVAGTTFTPLDGDFGLVRYNQDGSLDSSFGTNGIVLTDFGGSDVAKSVAIQPDGKILVAGGSDIGNGVFALARYNSDGSLDNSFDTDGKVTTDIGNFNDWGNSVVLQQDGKIIVAGVSNDGNFFDFALVRYNQDGSLDPSFDSDGKVTTDFNSGNDFSFSVVLQPDGKILAAGGADIGNGVFALARYNSDGSLDNSFSSDGKVTTAVGSESFGFSVTLQTDGKIVMAGYSGTEQVSDFAAVRYISGLILGLVDLSIESGTILIYPNPIQDVSVLEYTLAKDENLSIELYDVSGRLIRSFLGQEMRTIGTHKETLNFNEIATGNYVLMLHSKSGRLGVKIIKQ